MASIIIPGRGTRPPPHPEIDWRHPLARDLALYWLPGMKLELVSDCRAVTTHVRAQGDVLAGAVTTANVDFPVLSGVPDPFRAEAVTMGTIVTRAFGQAAHAPLLRVGTTGSSNRALSIVVLSSNTTYLYESSNTVGSVSGAAQPVPTRVGATIAIGATRVGGWPTSGTGFFVSRVDGSAVATTPASINWTSNAFSGVAAALNDGTLGWTGSPAFRSHVNALWKRSLTDAEWNEWRRAPYQMLRSRQYKFVSIGSSPVAPELQLPGVIDIGTTSARPRVTLNYA